MIYCKESSTFDLTKSHKFKECSKNFQNKYELDGYLIGEFMYLPLLNHYTRMDLMSRFENFPLKKDLWRVIDLIYAYNIWIPAARLFNERIKSIYRQQRALSDEIAFLSIRPNQVYTMFNTYDITNQNIFSNYENLISSYREEISIDQFLWEDYNNKKIHIPEKAKPVWQKLIECIQNIAYNNFLNMLKARLESIENIDKRSSGKEKFTSRRKPTVWQIALFLALTKPNLLGTDESNKKLFIKYSREFGLTSYYKSLELKYRFYNNSKKRTSAVNQERSINSIVRDYELVIENMLTDYIDELTQAQKELQDLKLKL